MAKQRLRPNIRGGMGGRIVIPASVTNSEQGMYRQALETIVVPMGWQIAMSHFEQTLREGKKLPQGQELESFFADCLDMAKKWSSVSLAWKEDQIKEMSNTEEIPEVPESKARKVIVE